MKAAHRFEALPYFADFAKIACPILQDLSFIVKDSLPKIILYKRWCMRNEGDFGMTVRERVLAIRLMEQQEKKPEYFEKLGIYVTMNKVEFTTSERGK